MGQSPPLQVVDTVPYPLQPWPPWAGLGLLQDLVFDFRQSLPHFDQADQLLQPPSTGSMFPMSVPSEAIKYDTLPLKSRGLTRASINTVKSTALHFIIIILVTVGAGLMNFASKHETICLSRIKYSLERWF